ncbi:hypothetical protein BD289DRAFT_479771 [Coniella lustricola]|uniref:Extracellular membrane protein CFEM domain-containing protein n=1 Tax=Coniella lustricola TaxID=2025994 RepID=A0A2T3AHW3_9PEZI|nr:hypothetical protein BD289DRAFT_479771 [Coniella lustricola]
MKSTIVSLAALLAPMAVLAQSTTTEAYSSTTTCAADYIVETCLTSTEANQAACGNQDYSCQCAAYQAIVTCFNNCPGDARQSTYQGLVTQYCALASQYSSTNTVAATSTASVSGSESTAAAAAATTATTSGSDSSSSSTATSSSASSSSSANSGAHLAKGAGGVLAAVAGVAAALL